MCFGLGTKKKFTVLMILGLTVSSLEAKVTSASGKYEGRAHFIISTGTATYYLDKSSGGLSRMLDRKGNDWIAFKIDPWNIVPSSAASSFRGIPNLVFQGDDGGVGHPGWNKCITTQLDDSTFLVKDLTEKWSFTWSFSMTNATLFLNKVDTARTYWFLYEGTVSGRFAPQRQYWATDVDGIRTDTPNIFNRESSATGLWKWAYFGDRDSDIILFAVQHNSDNQRDFFAYMGSESAQNESEEGMVVFGFGRSDKPLLNSPGNVFSIGFIEGISMDNDSYRQVGETINLISN